jgi:hypothetical protein
MTATFVKAEKTKTQKGQQEIDVINGINRLVSLNHTDNIVLTPLKIIVSIITTKEMLQLPKKLILLIFLVALVKIGVKRITEKTDFLPKIEARIVLQHLTPVLTLTELSDAATEEKHKHREGRTPSRTHTRRGRVRRASYSGWML